MNYNILLVLTTITTLLFIIYRFRIKFIAQQQKIIELYLDIKLISTLVEELKKDKDQLGSILTVIKNYYQLHSIQIYNIALDKTIYEINKQQCLGDYIDKYKNQIISSLLKNVIVTQKIENQYFHMIDIYKNKSSSQYNPSFCLIVSEKCDSNIMNRSEIDLIVNVLTGLIFLSVEEKKISTFT